MTPIIRGTAALMILLPIGVGIAALPAAPKPDSCQVSERDVRGIYNSLLARPEYRHEPERTRVTKELVASAETLCREQRDAKPRPLPAELQSLAR